MTTGTVNIPPAPLRLGTVFKGFVMSAALATALNGLVLAASLRVFSISPQFGPLGLGPQMTATVAAAAASALMLTLLVRYTGRPARTFYIISGVVFAASFVPVWAYATADPSNPGTTLAAVVALCVTHVIALVCITPVQALIMVSHSGANHDG